MKVTKYQVEITVIEYEESDPEDKWGRETEVTVNGQKIDPSILDDTDGLEYLWTVYNDENQEEMVYVHLIAGANPYQKEKK